LRLEEIHKGPRNEDDEERESEGRSENGRGGDERRKGGKIGNGKSGNGNREDVACEKRNGDAGNRGRRAHEVIR